MVRATPSPSDSQRWRAFKNGDQHVLSGIFLQYYDALYRYGFRLTSDPDIAKDSIQNLFLKLWNHRRQLDDVQEIRPYLFRALRSQLIDNYRERQGRFRLWLKANEERLEVTFSHEDFIISTQISEEQSRQLFSALNKLTKRQREAIYLRFFDAFEYDRIAEIMQVNIQSVRNLIHQGIRQLRDQLVLPLLFLFGLLS